MKTFWLSFCDGDRPKGEQFLGVCVVDVSDDDAADALVLLEERFPNHADGAEWVAAATRRAHEMSCNPGGEVASIEMPKAWPGFETCPRNRLLSLAQLQELELV